MCIVADIIRDVSNTKIACFHVAYKNSNNSNNSNLDPQPIQLIVYAADIDSVAKTNGLILPVYNPGNDVKKIIPLDLSEYGYFFSDVKEFYSKWYKDDVKQLSYSMTNCARSSYPLEVHKVGDYKFSLMPSKKDFDRLDRSQLNVNPAAKASINVHSDDYSFVVFQFYDVGKVEITPFGYLSPFAGDNTMIIPTIHGHPEPSGLNGMGGTSLANAFRQSTDHHHVNNFRNDEMASVKTAFNLLSGNESPTDLKFWFETEAVYDHEIYLLFKDPKSTVTDKSSLVKMNHILKKINTDYQGNNIKLFVPKNFIPRKIVIKGLKPNSNIKANVNGHMFCRDLIIDSSNVNKY